MSIASNLIQKMGNICGAFEHMFEGLNRSIRALWYQMPSISCFSDTTSGLAIMQDNTFFCEKH